MEVQRWSMELYVPMSSLFCYNVKFFSGTIRNVSIYNVGVWIVRFANKW